MQIPGLSALISPFSLAEFLSQYWPHEMFVVHDLNPSIRAITELSMLQSLDHLLNLWPASVQVHLPDASDESSSVHASPADARKLFANKMALLFNNVQNVCPELHGWLTALRNDLGLPNSTHARAMIYATPDGKGTAPHFDQNINFVLQLQGTKKWRLAANTSVVNPTERHTLGQPLDAELATCIVGELPGKMPHASCEVTLKPGSMLFVPRGVWHTTEAQGEALALNFTFNQPTWIDLFTIALRSRLLLSEEWRELADGVTSRDPSVRQRASARFDLLLMELVEDLPNWRAQDILNATEGDLGLV